LDKEQVREIVDNLREDGTDGYDDLGMINLSALVDVSELSLQEAKSTCLHYMATSISTSAPTTFLGRQRSNRPIPTMGGQAIIQQDYSDESKSKKATVIHRNSETAAGATTATETARATATVTVLLFRRNPGSRR